jgi:hypothetical protein
MENERPQVRLLITQPGIILALITAAAYFCVLSVQVGYNSYFKVPSEFTSLSSTIVFSLSWQLIFIFAGILFVLASIFFC